MAHRASGADSPERGGDSAEADRGATWRAQRRLACGAERLEEELVSARRRLARTRRRQRDAERLLREAETSVCEVAERLGLQEGAPEMETWREIAKEQSRREQELQRQTQDTRDKRQEKLEGLRRRLASVRSPQTASSQESVKNQAWCRSLDEHFGRLQVVHEYLAGRLEDLAPEELRLLLRTPAEELDSRDGSLEALTSRDQRLGRGTAQHEALVREALLEMQGREEVARDSAMRMSDSIFDRRDSLTKALASGALGRGLGADAGLCEPSEQGPLRRLMPDIVALCRWHAREAAAGHAR